jgi:PAS domain S-box-containing protein
MRVKPGRRPRAGGNGRQRARLLELEETLRAIRSGEVDALVVETAGGNQVFTLKGADQTYRLMVEEMQEGAATLSRDGIVLYCNSFLAGLLDLPVEAVLGAPLSAFLDEQACVSLSGLLRAAEQGVSRSEVSFRSGASSLPTQVSVTLLPLEGAPVFCMIVTDLTERKGWDEERAQLAREQVARASAENANRLKDEFLATLSHELRSPLNAIVAWSHILCEPGLDPVTAGRAIQAIDRNARAQTQLVADILDVSRIVTGKFHMNSGPVRLSDVIEAAADTVRLAAQTRQIRLEFAIDPRAAHVWGDANRLQQVVWNLLSNAVKFVAVGGLVLVGLTNSGGFTELSVTDDGPGIEPAFLPFVFDRFRQADSSSTRRHGGLGLGLAIVRHLVELHGGTVEARNRKDRSGTVFSVRLPRLEPALTDPQSSEAEAPASGREEWARPVPTLHDVSILIVDDEADTREAMGIGLGRHGARVATAASAGEALAMLVRERPQVLVADIGMAVEDGYALIRKVRELPMELGGATPAIALTGYANPQDRVDAFRAGFQDHVAKPVTPAALAAAVARCLLPSTIGKRPA